jgi:hypothetical protein
VDVVSQIVAPTDARQFVRTAPRAVVGPLPDLALPRGDADRGGTVPDSFGKRNREKVKAKKAEARDDRRVARSQRRKGIVPLTERRPDMADMPPMGDAPDASDAETGEAGTEPAADA